jgi:hypothetical protein
LWGHRGGGFGHSRLVFFALKACDAVSEEIACTAHMATADRGGRWERDCLIAGAINAPVDCFDITDYLMKMNTALKPLPTTTLFYTVGFCCLLPALISVLVLSSCERPSSVTEQPTSKAEPQGRTSSTNVIGTVIKFDQASEKYRVSGWNRTEGDFAWSSKSAKVAFPIPSDAGALTVTMTMRGLVQPPTVPVQPVELYVNDRKIADWQVSNTAPFTAEIPLELTRGQDNLNFELRIPNATSPKALGMSDDDRILGVCVYSIELKRS